MATRRLVRGERADPASSPWTCSPGPGRSPARVTPMWMQRAFCTAACGAWLAVFAPAASFQEGQVLPGDPFERLPEALKKNLEALDPGGGWSGEARASAALDQMKRFLTLLPRDASAA